MKYLETFNSFKPVNEEFIGKLLSGALGKVFQMFSAPFKNMIADFKSQFKEDDPNSIKKIIMDSLNKAIDGVKGGISKINDEKLLSDIMNQFSNKITELANGLDKDIDTAIGKDKSSAPKMIAKSILLGNKDANWLGIVGLINGDNYKYSKIVFEKLLSEDKKDINSKKNIATKFLEDFKRDITIQLDKNFNEDEIKKLYDESKKNPTSGMNYQKLKELFDSKISVLYKMDGYDDNKPMDEQKSKIGTKKIESLDEAKQEVKFKTDDGKFFVKSFSDIIGTTEGGDNAKKAAEVLGKIKTDEKKMKQVVNFANFLLNNKDQKKSSQIYNIIKPTQNVTQKGA